MQNSSCCISFLVVKSNVDEDLFFRRNGHLVG